MSRNRPASAAVAGLGQVLLDAEWFYRSQLARSWAPGYLHSRGFGQATWTRWPP